MPINPLDIVLGLDLDKNLWVTKKHRSEIDPRIPLHGWMTVKTNTNRNSQRREVALIYRDFNKKLIEYACTYLGGIMFLTTGEWSAHNIKKNLIYHYHFSPEIADKVTVCHFLSPKLAAQLFPNKNLHEIRAMLKSHWLDAFFKKNGDSTTHVVVVDDCIHQIQEYKKNPRVLEAIQATTCLPHSAKLLFPGLYLDKVMNTLRSFAPMPVMRTLGPIIVSMPPKKTSNPKLSSLLKWCCNFKKSTEEQKTLGIELAATSSYKSTFFIAEKEERKGHHEPFICEEQIAFDAAFRDMDAP